MDWLLREEVRVREREQMEVGQAWRLAGEEDTSAVHHMCMHTVAELTYSEEASVVTGQASPSVSTPEEAKIHTEAQADSSAASSYANANP